jgi:hypothetical protein
MTDSVPNDAATTPASQTANTTTQFNTKSGKGMIHGVISELTSFWEVRPGHEDELRAAVQQFVGALQAAPLSETMKTGLRDLRFVIFDGGKRLLFATTFETDWDPYIEDALIVVGVDNFIDWMQHTTAYEKVAAWVNEAGGVEKLRAGRGSWETDTAREKSVRMSSAGLKQIVLSVQTPAASYFNTVSDLTNPQIRKAQQVEQAFQQVLDSPGAAEALQQPALKPLLELAAD